jgi:hypothetical protein
MLHQVSNIISKINYGHMHCLYQKDEGTLPGNLQNRKYKFLAHSPNCSVSHYLPTFFLLSPSLQSVKGWNIIAFLYGFVVCAYPPVNDDLITVTCRENDYICRNIAYDMVYIDRL